MRYALLIALLLIGGCSKPENPVARLIKYAKENNVVYVTDFPIYFNVEIVGVPDLRTRMENWLLGHGFKKGLGAAFDTKGKLISQEYLFGDTFTVNIASLVGNITLVGYGIRTSDQNVEPTLKELIQFIEAHYKTIRKELKAS